MELTDIHCHLIPFVDDGARSMKEARKLLEMEYRSGVRNIIVTPHYRKGMFETSDREIRRNFGWLKETAWKVASDLRVYLGCEFHTRDSMAEYLDAHRRPTMAGTSYVLVEFSARHSYDKIWNQVNELASHGYQPIIAHVERYPCVCENPECVVELREMGTGIQVNAGSILGEDGWVVKRFCRMMMKNDWIDFVGTDAHDIRVRRPNLGKCAEYVQKKIGEEYAQKLFVDNPRKILNEIH